MPQTFLQTSHGWVPREDFKQFVSSSEVPLVLVLPSHNGFWNKHSSQLCSYLTCLGPAPLIWHFMHGHGAGAVTKSVDSTGPLHSTWTPLWILTLGGSGDLRRSVCRMIRYFTDTSMHAWMRRHGFRIPHLMLVTYRVVVYYAIYNKYQHSCWDDTFCGGRSRIRASAPEPRNSGAGSSVLNPGRKELCMRQAMTGLYAQYEPYHAIAQKRSLKSSSRDTVHIINKTCR